MRRTFSGSTRPLLLSLGLIAGFSGSRAHAVNGDIAFSTNRDGNYEIYKMRPNGSSLVNLTNNPADDSTPSWNRDSTRIAFASKRPNIDRELYTMNADGSAQNRYSTHAGDDAYPVWNPNQSRILYTSSLSGQPDLWYVDTGGEAPSGLQAAAQQRDGIDSFAAWSPDATRVVFASQRTENSGSAVGDFNLWVMTYDPATDSFGTPLRLMDTPGDDIHPRWNKTGTKIVFASQRTDNDSGNITDFNIWSMDFNKASNTAELPVRLTNDPGNDVWPAFAPEGDKIAFQSDRSGNNDIWIMNNNGSAQINLTASSPADDVEPTWSKQQETPSLVVTIATDTKDFFDGKISLREALNYAATLTGPQTISFIPALEGGSVMVSTVGDTTEGNSAFPINSEVIIQGPPGGITIQCDDTPYALRGFYVFADQALTLRGLTLAGFHQVGGTGSNFGEEVDMAGKDARGGTVFNGGGVVRLEDCLVRDSYVQGGVGGTRAFFNFDTLEMDYYRGAGGSGLGGAIYNSVSGTLVVVQSTFTANSATGGLGGLNNGERAVSGSGLGGAIANSGSASIVASTIAFNSVTGSTAAGGAVRNTGGTLELQSSILAGSANAATDADNSGGTWTSTSSVVQKKSAGVPGGGLAVTDPKLIGLADNGGPTGTMALQVSSPAINGGDDAVLAAPYNLTNDQRGTGFPRKLGSRVDAGAFEAAIPLTPPVLSITTPPDDAVVVTLPQVQGTAADSDGFQRLDLYLQRNSDSKWWTGSTWGSSTALTLSLTGTSWTCSSVLPSGANLAAGQYTLSLRGEDIFDNKTVVNSSFVVDKSVPLSVAITSPVHQSAVKVFTPVTGTATDNVGGSGIGKVELTLRRVSDSKYWSGSAWLAAETKLQAVVNGTNWSKSTGFPAPGANADTQIQDGKYILMAVSFDKAGNKVVTAARSDFTLDRTAPASITFDVPADESIVKVLTTASGIATDNAGGSGIGRVDFTLRRVSDLKYWNGTAWDTPVTQLPTVISGTKWTKNTGFPAAGTNVNTQLVEGKYTMMATAYDKANNVLASSARSDITIDRSVPTAVTITTPPHLSAVKLLSAVGTATDNVGGSGIGRVDLSLRRVSDLKYWSGTAWVTTIVQLTTTVSGTNWTKNSGLPQPGTDPDTQLLEGKYTFTANAYDKALNKAAAAARSDFTVDRSLPTVAISSPANNSVVASLTTLGGTASDAISGTASVNLILRRLSDNFYWNGTAWVASVSTLVAAPSPTTPGNSTWSYGSVSQPMPKDADLVDGTYVLLARGVDKAGNLSTQVSSKFTLTRPGSVLIRGSEAGAAPAVSGVQLSTIAASTDSSVRMLFTGALDINSALDATRYSVTRNGESLAVQSAGSASGNSITLGLEEGAVKTGDLLQVSYTILDAGGHSLQGTASVRVR